MAVQFSLCDCMCAVNSGAGASVYDHTTTKTRGKEGNAEGRRSLFTRTGFKCEKKPALLEEICGRVHLHRLTVLSRRKV